MHPSRRVRCLAKLPKISRGSCRSPRRHPAWLQKAKIPARQTRSAHFQATVRFAVWAEHNIHAHSLATPTTARLHYIQLIQQTNAIAWKPNSTQHKHNGRKSNPPRGICFPSESATKGLMYTGLQSLQPRHLRLPRPPISSPAHHPASHRHPPTLRTPPHHRPRNLPLSLPRPRLTRLRNPHTPPHGPLTRLQHLRSRGQQHPLREPHNNSNNPLPLQLRSVPLHPTLLGLELRLHVRHHRFRFAVLYGTVGIDVWRREGACE